MDAYTTTQQVILWGLFMATAVMATAFPLLYLLRAWYSTPEGRAIMLFGISMALLHDTIAMLSWFGRDMDSTVRFTLWVTVLGFTLSAATYKVVVLLKGYIKDWRGSRQSQPRQ